MINKLVVIINSLKVPKIKKKMLYEVKFLVPIYSCLQNPWLGGYCPQILVFSVLCPQLNPLNSPPPEQNSWVRQCPRVCSMDANFHSIKLGVIWDGMETTTVRETLRCSNQLSLVTIRRWIFCDITDLTALASWYFFPTLGYGSMMLQI